MDHDEMELFDKLISLVEAKKYREVANTLSDMNEVDIAQFLEELAPLQATAVFRTLPKELGAEVFANLDPENQMDIITAATDSELSFIIEELAVDDAVDMLGEMPANVVKRVLKNAEKDTRALINQFFNYPENSAGSIMTAEFTELRKNMTVTEAIEHIRRTGEDRETIYTCYVVGTGRMLEGVITVKDLLLAPDDEPISELMITDVIKAKTSDDREEVSRMLAKYGFLSLPVVDGEGRLVGIVTVDDALDVLTEETTEDLEVMAAITPTDKPYLKTSTFETWKKRIPWLLILMVSATFTGIIITSFETALAAQVVLTAFIPMLMDTGGNSGSQASVTIVRGISLGEIEFSDLPRVIWKEAKVAVLCGITLGAANFLKLLFIDRVGLPITCVVCITLVITVLVAKIVGCSLPMIAKKIGFDPAVMASPFITTTVDAISLLIYFGTAKLLLGI